MANHLVLILRRGSCRWRIFREGLVLGIFEQAGGADGDGAVDSVKEDQEITHQSLGKFCREKMLEDFLVGLIERATGYSLFCMNSSNRSVQSTTVAPGGGKVGVLFSSQWVLPCNQEGEAPAFPS